MSRSQGAPECGDDATAIPEDITSLLKNGDIEPVMTCSGKVIDLRDLAGKALDLWSLTTIEETLGRDAGADHAAGVADAEARGPHSALPSCRLKILAEASDESVDTMLERMFQKLVWNEEERLAPRIPGLAEASRWPEVVSIEQPS